MPMYTLLVEDNFGKGQPVAFYFVRDANTASIRQGLQIFSEVHYISSNCETIMKFIFVFFVRKMMFRRL